MHCIFGNICIIPCKTKNLTLLSIFQIYTFGHDVFCYIYSIAVSYADLENWAVSSYQQSVIAECCVVVITAVLSSFTMYTSAVNVAVTLIQINNNTRINICNITVTA